VLAICIIKVYLHFGTVYIKQTTEAA